MAITLSANGFLSSLTNLIAYTYVVPTFKDGDMGEILAKCKYDDATVGDGVVFRTAGIGAAGNLNIAASSLLSVNTPSGATEQYLPINNKRVIPLTINKNILAQAFVNETGLSDYINETLKGMEIVKKFDIFSTIVGSIDGYTPTSVNGVQTVHVFDTSALTDPNQLRAALDQNAKILLKEIAKVSKSMRYLDNTYNDANAYTVCDKDDLYLITTESTRLGIDFDTLASMFNDQYATSNKGWKDIVSLPDSKLPTWVSGDVACMLVHRNKFVYGFLYQFAGMFFDLSNLNEQHFVHYAYYNGIVAAANAVEFVISADITPAALS